MPTNRREVVKSYGHAFKKGGDLNDVLVHQLYRVKFIFLDRRQPSSIRPIAVKSLKAIYGQH